MVMKVQLHTRKAYRDLWRRSWVRTWRFRARCFTFQSQREKKVHPMGMRKKPGLKISGPDYAKEKNLPTACPRGVERAVLDEASADCMKRRSTWESIMWATKPNSRKKNMWKKRGHLMAFFTPPQGLQDRMVAWLLSALYMPQVLLDIATTTNSRLTWFQRLQLLWNHTMSTKLFFQVEAWKVHEWVNII